MMLSSFTRTAFISALPFTHLRIRKVASKALLNRGPGLAPARTHGAAIQLTRTMSLENCCRKLDLLPGVQD